MCLDQTHPIQRYIAGHLSLMIVNNNPSSAPIIIEIILVHQGTPGASVIGHVTVGHAAVVGADVVF